MLSLGDGTSLSQKSSIDNEEDKAILVDLYGNNFFQSLRSLLSSINMKNLSKIEVIWFDVGRKPFVK